MKLPFTLFFLLISSILIAQNCKPAFSSVDDFTEQTVEGWGGKIASKSTIIDGNGYDIYFYAGSDGKEFFGLTVVTFIIPAGDSSTFDIGFKEGDEIMLKTDSGVLKINISEVIKNQKRVLSNFYVSFQLSGLITREDIENVSSNPITKLRIPTAQSSPIQKDIKKGKSKKLLKQFKCLLKTI